jgi:hypothetical protein
MATEAFFPRKSTFTRSCLSSSQPYYRAHLLRRIGDPALYRCCCRLRADLLSRRYGARSVAQPDTSHPRGGLHPLDGQSCSSNRRLSLRIAWPGIVGSAPSPISLPPVMIVLGTIAGIDALACGVMIGPLDPGHLPIDSAARYRLLCDSDLCGMAHSPPLSASDGTG